MHKAIHRCSLSVFSATGLLACVISILYPLAIDAGQSKRDTYTTVIQSGSVSGHYTKKHSPILIKGNVIVPADTSLIFDAGCKVYIGGENTCIAVFGAIDVRGSKNAPVVFQSARPDPKPWDWDRIYCRSRKQSRFTHCVVQHANYGVFVENGSAEIRRSIFEKNSLHAITVRNARVRISHTQLRRGHVSALRCRAGADIIAESLTVQDNITGIACENRSVVRINSSSIRSNTTGIVVAPQSDAQFIKTPVTRNRTGLITTEEVTPRQAQMVYHNGQDIRKVPSVKLKEHLTPPQRIASLTIPTSSQQIETPDNFTPGFLAQKNRQNTRTAFMGNITTGIGYFDPRSFSQQITTIAYDTAGTARDTTIDTTISQTQYIGEQSESILDRFQPHLQLFANGRRKNSNVNIMADIYGNTWVPGNIRARNLRLTFDYGDHKIYAGDYMLSESELTFFGRSFTGLRYHGAFMEMGKGDKRFEADVGIGETQVSKDSGDHDRTLVNTIIDSGMSQRQQMSYYGLLRYKPHYDVTVEGGCIAARDQANNPALRTKIDDPGRPNPIEAQTVFLATDADLMNGDVSVGAEVAVGVHDTLAYEDTLNRTSPEIRAINWYDPELGDIGSSLSEGLGKGTHTAASVYGEGRYSGYILTTTLMYISSRYFSAANPYLETDRRTAQLSVARDITTQLSASGEYEYEKRFASNIFSLNGATESSPQHLHTLSVGTRYAPGEHLPVFTGDLRSGYETRKEVEDSLAIFSSATDIPEGVTARYLIDTTNNDTAFSAELPAGVRTHVFSQLLNLSARHRLSSGLTWGLTYKLLWDNEIGNHPDTTQQNIEDRLRNTIQGRCTLRPSRRLHNSTRLSISPYTEARDNIDGLSYQISNRLKVYIVPRLLSLELNGEYAATDEEKDSDYSDARERIRIQSYYAQCKITHSISRNISWDISIAYDHSEDETDYSQQNYRAYLGALNVTCLF